VWFLSALTFYNAEIDVIMTSIFLNTVCHNIEQDVTCSPQGIETLFVERWQIISEVTVNCDEDGNKELSFPEEQATKRDVT
jgi:hypothetical protein